MLRGWYGFLLDRWDTLRGSYWFLPGLLTIASGLAALGLIELDRRHASDWLAANSWMSGASAPAARSVLSTIAGSMMTVTGVVFSITIVALTLTSSQFGPRLLRTFFRDRGSQLVLGAFLATFIFNLLALRAVEDVERVPILATTVALGLAVLSLFVLIYFIHHVATSIQASSVIAAVAAEIDQQLPTLFPERIGSGAEDPQTLRALDRERLARIDEEGEAIRASQEGYLRVLDDEALLELARERDLLVRICVTPGDFVTTDAVLARIHPASHAGEAERATLEACFRLGDHRTPVQDLAFLTDQLSEMAVRALSPGVNDPRTAVACIHRLGGVVARIAGRSMPSGRRTDGDGCLRVVAEPTRFEDIVAGCFDAIRRYGASDAQVAVALLAALEAGGHRCATVERRRALEEHAHEVHREYTRAEHGSKRDLDLVTAALDRTLLALAG